MEAIQAESTLTTASGPRIGHPRLWTEYTAAEHLLQCPPASSRPPRHSVRRIILGKPGETEGFQPLLTHPGPGRALVIAGCGGRNSYVPTPDSRDHLFPIDFDITSHSRSYTDTPRVKVASVQGPKLLVPRSSGRLQLPPRSRDCMPLLKADYLRAELQGNHTHSPTPQTMLISEDCMRPLRMCRHLSCPCYPLGSVPPRLHHHTLLLFDIWPCQGETACVVESRSPRTSRADPSHC